MPFLRELIDAFLASKICVLRQKLFMICAIRAGVNLGILACEISVLSHNLVIICATRAGAILGVLA